MKPPRGPSLRGRIAAAITERLGYKAVALFLAIAIWLFIHLNGRQQGP